MTSTTWFPVSSHRQGTFCFFSLINSLRCIPLLLSLLLIHGVFQHAFAEDISLNLSVEASGNLVRVEVESVGRDAASNLWVEVELVGNTYVSTAEEKLPTQQTVEKVFEIKVPQGIGTYPLYTTIFYENEGAQLSIVDVGTFTVGNPESSEANIDLRIPSFDLRLEEKISVYSSGATNFRLVTPEEIQVEATRELVSGREYLFRSKYPQFNLSSPYFAVLESVTPSGHAEVRIAKARISSIRVIKELSVFSVSFLFGALLVSIPCMLYFARRYYRDTDARIFITLSRGAFGVFVCSFFLLLFRLGYLIPEYLLPYLPTELPEASLGGRFFRFCKHLLLAFHFDGKDYDYFAEYIADPLYFYMLIGNFFVLHFLSKPQVENDKYWHLMKSGFSLFRLRLDPSEPPARLIYWSPLARVALLALLVKAFYLPLLTSWTINNIFHQMYLTEGLESSWEMNLLGFRKIHEYLMALLLLVDVAIFAAGYLSELPQLKNRIKSVEPTLLGWTVCLICYPPFNAFFENFNTSLAGNWQAASEGWQRLAMMITLFLWTIYVWATVALGWKASNLTNRGIVSHGPYRFLRHPAYAAKVSLWGVECFFFAMHSFYLMSAFVIIYALRAWTEERHLSADPDYKDYVKIVRWRFIPGVF